MQQRSPLGSAKAVVLWFSCSPLPLMTSAGGPHVPRPFRPVRRASYHGPAPEYKSISRRFERARKAGMMRLMRKITLAALVLAFAVPARAATGSGRSHVWLTDRSPATVRGASFSPPEHVAVTLSAGDVVLPKAASASQAGA